MSVLIFMSLIYFEFIFVYGVRKYSNFIHLLVAVQFSQQHLLKRLSFFLPFQRKVTSFAISDHRCVGLSLNFLSCSIDLYF